MTSPKRPEKGAAKVAMQTVSDYETCATRLKALADPDRLQIVNALLQGSKSVTALTSELKMPMDKVSHHLGVLRAANLVRNAKQGKFVIYSLSPEVAAAADAISGTSTIDLGCCQLGLVQLTPAPKKSRAKPSRKSS